MPARRGSLAAQPAFVAPALLFIAFSVLGTVPGFSRTLVLRAQSAALPSLTQPVTDLADVIDPSAEQQLDSLSRTLQAATGDVIVVVTVPGIEPYADIREYAVELFENHGRGIGERGKDNGLLILLAPNQRRVWIEVGYGLEQWITDGFAGETSRDYMTPSFRSGDYGAGLVIGMGRIAGRIAAGRNVTLPGIDVPRERQPARTGTDIPLWVVIMIFVAIALLSRHLGGPGRTAHQWGRRRTWSGWSSGVGPFGSGWPGGRGGMGGGFGGGFGGFGGGRSGGGGGGAGW
jgi:uncharacterized protein